MKDVGWGIPAYAGMTGGGGMGGMDVVGGRPRDSHTHVIPGVPAIIPAYPLRHSRIPTLSFPRRRESSASLEVDYE